jgi:two-component system response regulator HydG
MDFSDSQDESEVPVLSSRILMVDDDRSTCAMIAKMLSLHGYRVDVAYGPNRALELIQQNEYALALIDYRMPDMDGVELYRRIQEIRPEIVGVFLTGYPTIDTVFPAIGVGIQRVLAKPADSSELLEVVEQFVGRPG